jgi:hypothetical protein
VIQGVLKFEIKWEGYEKKADRTWEPEENLAYALHPTYTIIRQRADRHK